MTTQLEKQLSAQVAFLDRQVREIRKALGMDEKELLQMEYQEAIEQVGKGNYAPIKEYLKKINKKDDVRIMKGGIDEQHPTTN